MKFSFALTRKHVIAFLVILIVGWLVCKPYAKANGTKIRELDQVAVTELSG